jgi:hypothetical protein
MDYGQLGRINGWYQSAQWFPAGPTVTKVVFQYDGSYFPASSGALRAWQDGASYDLRFSDVQKLSCPPDAGTRCNRLSVLYKDKKIEYYDAIQYGRCLAETRALAPRGVFHDRQAVIVATLATMDGAAYSALTRTCG